MNHRMRGPMGRRRTPTGRALVTAALAVSLMFGGTAVGVAAPTAAKPSSPPGGSADAQGRYEEKAAAVQKKRKKKVDQATGRRLRPACSRTVPSTR